MPYRKKDSPMTRFMANETYWPRIRASESQSSDRSSLLPPIYSIALPGLVKGQMDRNQTSPPRMTSGSVDAAPSSRPFLCCLLYTSDAADDLLCVDLGGRRIIKKK